jgi:formylglycine-generating enzyme required for sulfatase activity
MTLLAVAGCALLAAAMLAQDPQEREQAAQVARLIAQLGDEAFARREAASQALDALGEPALAQLRQATTSENHEIRWRAQTLLTAPRRASKSIGLELVLIKAGEFAMGSPGAETGRQADEQEHRVRISRPFYLGRCEVTQEEYRLVMKSSPSWFAASGGGRDNILGQATTRFPVERITWFDAAEFCNQLSRLDGFRPYYRLTGVEKDGDSIVKATVAIAGGYGYRLPTEAEWEYACRAGAATPYHYGGPANGVKANLKGLTTMGGYGGVIVGPDLKRTTAVGSYPENSFGLFDMHGNVGEWCEDWYGKDYYGGSPAADPAGPADGNQRTWRGGSWLLTETSCRSASRAWHTPDERKNYLGFRVARNP